MQNRKGQKSNDNNNDSESRADRDYLRLMKMQKPHRIIEKITRHIKSYVWYDWIGFSAILLFIDILLHQMNIHYSISVVMFLIILSTSIVSLVEVLKGGLYSSHKRLNKDNSKKPHILRMIFDRTLASSVVLLSSFCILFMAFSLTDSNSFVYYSEPSSGPERIRTSDNDEVAQEDVKRWQYMLCSNGTYRYYTDEQFKDSQIGFTEEGEDACASSNNGTKTGLADRPPENNTTQSPAPIPVPQQRSSNVASQIFCSVYNDVRPTNVIEQPDPNMKEGVIRDKIGYNGSRRECKDSNSNIVSNEVIIEAGNITRYYGTYTYDQALRKAESICRTKIPAGIQNSTYFGDCVSRELDKVW